MVLFQYRMETTDLVLVFAPDVADPARAEEAAAEEGDFPVLVSRVEVPNLPVPVYMPFVG